MIKPELWKSIVPGKSVEIRQAYLHSDKDKTIRVRTAGDKGFITIKGRSVGASRPEYEYEIPLKDANELIRNFTINFIEKTRHYILYENKMWEVDEFKGLNKGLFVAEIELDSEDEKYALPEWVEKDITFDKRYSNSNLVLKPFSTW